MTQATILTGNRKQDVMAIIRNTKRHGIISVVRALMIHRRKNIFLNPL